MTYRFLGTEAEIPGFRKLQRYGQKVELDPEVAKDFIIGAGSTSGHAGACALLPEEEFQVIGFTTAELLHFSTPDAQVSDKRVSGETLSVAAFLEKKQAALAALDTYRNSLEVANG